MEISSVEDLLTICRKCEGKKNIESLTKSGGSSYGPERSTATSQTCDACNGKGFIPSPTGAIFLEFFRKAKEMGLLCLLCCMLLAFGSNAQSPQKPTKEDKKQVERERKDREKQVKETAKLKKQEDRIDAAEVENVPIGKNVSYDRFTDETTVGTKVMVIDPWDRVVPYGHDYRAIFAMYTVKDRFGTQPDGVVLCFSALTFGTSLDPSSLSMILDGSTRLTFGKMNYIDHYRSGDGSESGFFNRDCAVKMLSLDNYRAIVSSKSVEVEIGIHEFVLRPRLIRGLAALLEGL